MCYTIHTSCYCCCITHYMMHTNTNSTTGKFCWPTLLKCIRYTSCRWPSGLKHNGVHKVLTKWWYNNIWVQVLVLFNIVILVHGIKKIKFQSCVSLVHLETLLHYHFYKKNNIIWVSYIWIPMQLFLLKGQSHSSFIKELENSDPQNCRKGHWLVTIRVHTFRGAFLFVHVIKHIWNEVLCLVHCKLQLLATSFHKQLLQLLLCFLAKPWKRQRLLIFIMKWT